MKKQYRQNVYYAFLSFKNEFAKTMQSYSYSIKQQYLSIPIFVRFFTYSHKKRTSFQKSPPLKKGIADPQIMS